MPSASTNHNTKQAHQKLPDLNVCDCVNVKQENRPLGLENSPKRNKSATVKGQRICILILILIQSLPGWVCLIHTLFSLTTVEILYSVIFKNCKLVCVWWCCIIRGPLLCQCSSIIEMNEEAMVFDPVQVLIKTQSNSDDTTTTTTCMLGKKLVCFFQDSSIKCDWEIPNVSTCSTVQARL